MVSVNQVSVYFGSFCLFQKISFLINQRDRIGLVGKNGAGKSSLLKMIIGEMAYEEGSISKPTNLTLGYLPQQMEVSDQYTVFEEAYHAFPEIIDLEKNIEHYNKEIAQRSDYESESYHTLIEKLSAANERFHFLEGDSLHAGIEQTLLGLGFEREDFSKKTSELSGGWRMRIELAKILMQKPALLLLDEPTNHLDIESIQWLEDYLIDYPGAVLLISHDRVFLDKVTQRTVELSLGKLYDYKVSYSEFEKLKKERYEQQLASYQNQQKKIEETEKFIERFRYKATKSVQVQSRIKQLGKMDRIEVDELDKAKIHFRFPPAPPSGNLALEIKELGKSYGNHQVLNHVELTLLRNEKIAFVGKNGEGKSTLAKVIIGQLDHTGICKLGHNVTIGYYAQNQEDLLDENKTVFETIDDEARGEMRTKVRDLLGSFLFGGETIDKKVKVLSGGERSRLALAKMLLEPVNLLVLDEPTNHLDMASKDILKQALLQFDGTLILVSHDRYFLDGLVDKVYEFRNKNIKEYLGGIGEFLRKRRLANLKEIERKKVLAGQNQKEVSDQKILYEKRKKAESEIRKVRNKTEACEHRILKLEEKVAEMDLLLANPENISDQKLFEEYGQVKKQIEDEMLHWEKWHSELESLQKKRDELS